MRKLTLVLIIILAAVMPAAAMDIDLGGTIGGNAISMGFGTMGGNSGGGFAFGMDIGAETDLWFHENHGMYIGIGLNVLAGGNAGSAAFSIGTGYIYRTDITETLDLLVSVGPHVSGIGSANGRFGLASAVAVQYYPAENVFLRTGLGLGMDFLRFSDNTSNGMFWVTLAVPFFVAGYSF